MDEFIPVIQYLYAPNNEKKRPNGLQRGHVPKSVISPIYMFMKNSAPLFLYPKNVPDKLFISFI